MRTLSQLLEQQIFRYLTSSWIVWWAFASHAVRFIYFNLLSCRPFNFNCIRKFHRFTKSRTHVIFTGVLLLHSMGSSNSVQVAYTYRCTHWFWSLYYLIGREKSAPSFVFVPSLLFWHRFSQGWKNIFLPFLFVFRTSFFTFLSLLLRLFDHFPKTFITYFIW